MGSEGYILTAYGFRKKFTFFNLPITPSPIFTFGASIAILGGDRQVHLSYRR
jgi:hypothetical protein